MVTISFYDHTRALFANGEVDLSALKLMLLLGHAFDASATDLSGISGDEVSGSGWSAGGEPIPGAAITVTGTNEATLDADDLAVTATGGDIGPADGALIYDSASDYPLWYIAFGEEKTAGETTPFKATWNPSGIAVWREP